MERVKTIHVNSTRIICVQHPHCLRRIRDAGFNQVAHLRQSMSQPCADMAAEYAVTRNSTGTIRQMKMIAQYYGQKQIRFSGNYGTERGAPGGVHSGQ
jgi:hypothetical protein